MSPGLGENCFCKYFQKIGVIATGPEETLKVCFIIGKKARPELAVGCQTQTVTPVTEMVAQGRNKTQLSLRAIKPVHFCRSVHILKTLIFQAARTKG